MKKNFLVSMLGALAALSCLQASAISVEEVAVLIEERNFDAARAHFEKMNDKQAVLLEGFIDKSIQKEREVLEQQNRALCFLANNSFFPAVFLQPIPAIISGAVSGGASFFLTQYILGKPTKDIKSEDAHPVSCITGFLGLGAGVGLVTALSYLVYKLPKMIAERQLTNNTIKLLQALKKELSERHASLQGEHHEQ